MCSFEYAGIRRLLLQAQDVMVDFVDQTHRVQFSGFHSLFREFYQIAPVVQFLGKDSGGMEVRKNDVAVARKQRLVKLIAVSHLCKDMELALWFLNTG